MRKRRRKKRSARVQRDVRHISKRPRAVLHLPSLFTRKPYKETKPHDFGIPTDRRYFRPRGVSSSIEDTVGRSVPLRPHASRRFLHGVPERLRPYRPEQVQICVRRVKRRELLFRRGKVGKGRRVTPKRRYSMDSQIVCKR